MNETINNAMQRERIFLMEPSGCIMGPSNNSNHDDNGNVIDLKGFYNKLGDKADKLINLHNRVECKAAADEAFKIYKLMNRINRMFKHQANENIWE